MPIPDPLAAAEELASGFAANAAERERQGGTAWAERRRIRDSGLLLLRVPQGYGGIGADWPTTMLAIRTIARADSSLAHIFAWHHFEVITPELIGTPAQADRYYRGTAECSWFWGSAFNPQDRRLTASRRPGGLILNGPKSFCTGARGSDMLLVGAVEGDRPGTLAIAVPTARPGVVVNDDWEAMGQRQSDSGSISLTDVDASDDEVLAHVGPAPTLRQALRGSISQLMLANVFVGIAEGALADARGYTRAETRPWPGSGVARAADEPAIVHHYGEMWVHLRAAACLADEAAGRLEEAWERLGSLGPELVTPVAVAVNAAKVMATQVGLDVTTRTFEVMGARAATGHYNFDRYWRNLRTLTLHDPVEMKMRSIGRWYLDSQPPAPDVNT